MNNSSPDDPSAGLNRFIIAFFCITLLLAGCGGGSGGGSSDAEADASTSDNGNDITDTSAEELAARALAELGERIFFDENLSNPVGQSCGTCHDPATGFTDPDSVDNLSPVSVGADGVSIGTRNTPTASYARFIPPFSLASLSGGQFLDGRAETLEEQARAPFVNPLEMNMADEAAVVAKLRVAGYAQSFLSIFGANAFDDVTVAYTQMVTAIAAFERTDTFAPFSSKFDEVTGGGPASFTLEEGAGQVVFRAAGCDSCHRSPGPVEVFSDFRYSNIGVPANPAIVGVVDNGLGAALTPPNAIHNGKFRTPTLRNVALTAPYMHNGVFDTLEEVIDFYDDPGAFVPAVGANIDARLVPLTLSIADKANLLAFLKTLSDQ